MSAIFCHGDEQLHLARESMKSAQIDQKKEIQTVIQPAGQFYQAEEWVLCLIKSQNLTKLSLSSYHQKYILQKHGSLLTSIGLSRGPKLVASSLAARLNGYLGGYGTKVLVFGFPCRCKELIDQCLVSCLNCDLLLSGGFSGRNGYC